MPHAPSKPEQSQPRTSAPSAATTAPSAEESLKTQQQPPYPRHTETPAPAHVQTPHDDQPPTTKPARYAPSLKSCWYSPDRQQNQVHVLAPHQGSGNVRKIRDLKLAEYIHPSHYGQHFETKRLSYYFEAQMRYETPPDTYPDTHLLHIRIGHTSQAHT